MIPEGYLQSVLIFSLIMTVVRANPVYNVEKLCGSNLSGMLSEICLEYHEPADQTESGRGPGLVDECCKKACSYNTLLKYCKTLKQSTTRTSDIYNKYGRVAETPKQQTNMVKKGNPTKSKDSESEKVRKRKRKRKKCKRICKCGRRRVKMIPHAIPARVGTVSPDVNKPIIMFGNNILKETFKPSLYTTETY